MMTVSNWNNSENERIASGEESPEAVFYTDSDNYYNLEEEDSTPDDESPVDPEGEPRKQSPLRILIEMLTGPAEGWKKLRRANFSIEKIASGCFYPMLAAAALTKFADLFYFPDSSLSEVLVKALVVFISYFFSYFIAPPVIKILLPKAVKSFADSKYCKQMVMMMLATLALFQIAINLLPMLEPVLVFLPLWTIYLITKGTKFIKIPKDKTTTTTGALCVVIVGAPMLVGWVFNSILP